MDDNTKQQLQKQLEDYTKSLISEEVIDQKQLERIKLISNQIFLSEIQDAEKALDELTEAIVQQTIDFKESYARAVTLHSKSKRIGAIKVGLVCLFLMKCCKEENAEGCRKNLQDLTSNFLVVKDKLNSLLQLRQQVMQAKD